MTTTLSGANLQIPDGVLGNAAISEQADIARSKMAQHVLAEYPVPFDRMRTWDAWNTSIPATPAADDLGLVTGTFGTDFPTLETGDLKAAGSTSRKAGFEIVVPANYDEGQTIQVRIRAGMETTVADTAATVDLEVYKSDGDGGVGSDLCSTSATSVNSLTLNDYEFTLTATDIDPGNRLQCVVTFLVNDAATGTAVTGVVSDVRLMLDTRG